MEIGIRGDLGAFYGQLGVLAIPCSYVLAFSCLMVCLGAAGILFSPNEATMIGRESSSPSHTPPKNHSNPQEEFTDEYTTPHLDRYFSPSIWPGRWSNIHLPFDAPISPRTHPKR